MTGTTDFDWIWLGNGAIDEFKQWRTRAGATAASASSYATGARAYVHYCRGIGLDPGDATESFHAHLARVGDLSAHARSDYRSHARAFVRFLEGRRASQLSGPQYHEAVSSPYEEARPSVAVAISDSDAADLSRTIDRPTESPRV